MPAYLVYVLIALAVGSAAGIDLKLGGGISSLFTLIGFLVVIKVLWEPLIEPLIKKTVKND